jgi:hypothetical protein
MSIKSFREIKLFQPGLRLVCWEGMLNGDTGNPLFLARFSDKSVQLIGTLGTGGNCRIEGSNQDGGTPTFLPLNNPQGTVLDMAALGIKEILENTYLIRPNITGGDGTTSLNVYLLVKQ